MFSMLPAQAHTLNQSRYYTPNTSSPLSSSPLRATSVSPLGSRNANILSHVPLNKTMSSPPSSSSLSTPQNIDWKIPENTLVSPPLTRRENSFRKRATKPNPLFRSGGDGRDGRETRRKLFLKSVKEGSEAKRWSDRGGDEEIMRCLWVAEERRRGERKKTESLALDAVVNEDEELSVDEIMADQVAREEALELEALVMGFSQHNRADDIQAGDGGSLLLTSDQYKVSPQWDLRGQVPVSTLQNQSPDTDTLYGSDNDEYDHIFMDIVQEENRKVDQEHFRKQGSSQDTASLELMDMS